MTRRQPMGKLKEKTLKGGIQEGQATGWKILSCLLLLLIFAGLLWQGLIFEADYLPAILLLSLLAVGFISAKLWYKEPIGLDNVYMLALGGLVLVYGLSIIQAAYARTAVLAFSKLASCLLVLLLVHNLKGKLPLSQWFQWAFILSGLTTAILGLDAVWGGHLVGLINRLVSGGQVQEGTEFLFKMILGDRLASVFQYPNTTAAYLMVTCLVAVYQGAKATNPWLRYGLLSSSALMLSAFILTYSRGGYLLAFFLILLYFCLLQPLTRRLALVILAFDFLTALGIGFLFLPGRPGREWAGKGWLVGLGICWLVALMAQVCLARLKVPQGQARKIPPRAALGLVALLVIGGSAGLGLVWFWTEPIQLMAGQSLDIRRDLYIREPGDYRLELEFTAPLDETLAGLNVSITSQNRKNLILNEFPTAGASAIGLEANWGSSHQTVPFGVEADGQIQSIRIYGPVGDGNNQIKALQVRDGSGKLVKAIKLSPRLLPEATLQRLQGLVNPKSALDRFAFYLDGFEILKDHWLLGTGGGGWEYRYGQYQNFNYVSNDIHSYPVQVAVETGLLGLVCFGGFVLLLLGNLVTQLKKRDEDQGIILMALLGLLAHSCIDFDFVFFSYGLIFWFMVGLLEDSPKWFVPWQSKARNLAKFRLVGYGSLVLVLGLSVFWPARCYWAANNAQNYTFAAAAGDRAGATAYIQRALAQDPLKAEYKIALAKLMVLRREISQEEYDQGNGLVAAATKQGQYNVPVLQSALEYYQKSAQWQQAYGTAEQIVACRPLRAQTWEGQAVMIQSAMDWSMAQGDLQAADQWRQLGLQLPERMAHVGAQRWVPVEPTQPMEALLAQWQGAAEVAAGAGQ